MKYMSWFIVIGLLVLLPAVARAELDGNRLLQKCEPIEKLSSGPESMTSSEASGVVYCLGYLDSFLETFSFQVRAKIVPSLPYCMPEEVVPKKEIAGVVVEYLKANREELDKPAGYYIFMALREKYPCNEEGGAAALNNNQMSTQ